MVNQPGSGWTVVFDGTLIVRNSDPLFSDTPQFNLVRDFRCSKMFGNKVSLSCPQPTQPSYWWLFWCCVVSL